MHHISVTAQYSPRKPAVSNNHHHATDLPLRPTTRNATWSVEYLESTFVMINNFPLIIKISSTPTKRLRFGTIRNMTLGSATCLAAERGTKRRTTTRRGRRAKIIGEMILDAEMAMTNSDIINVNIISFLVGSHSFNLAHRLSKFTATADTFQVQHLRQGQQYRGKGH